VVHVLFVVISDPFFVAKGVKPPRTFAYLPVFLSIAGGSPRQCPTLEGKFPFQSMIPGPDLVLKLPDNGSLVKIRSILSGNNVGARLWTDSRQIAPMLPDQPPFRFDPQTNTLFWTFECQEVGSIRFGRAKNKRPFWASLKHLFTRRRLPETFEGVPYAETPTLSQYRQAIENGMGTDPQKEVYLRTRFWWASNDPARGSQNDFWNDASDSLGSNAQAADNTPASSVGNTPPVLDTFAHANLIQLKSFLNLDDPAARLKAIEIYRQLEDFKEAEALLDFPFPEDMNFFVEFLKKLVSERSPALCRVLRSR